MKQTWFTECAIGLNVDDSAATAVLVTSATLAGSPRYVVRKVETLERTPDQSDADLVQMVLAKFPPSYPVIVVSHPLLSHCFVDRSQPGNQSKLRNQSRPGDHSQPGNQSRRGEPSKLGDALKPIGSAGGDIWRQEAGVLTADMGATRALITTVNAITGRRPSCPGAVSAIAAVPEIVLPPGPEHHFVIVAESPRYTVLAMDGGNIVFCRTFLAQSDAQSLTATIEEVLKTLHNRRPDWKPVAITWVGLAPDKKLIEVLSRMLPVKPWSALPERLTVSEQTPVPGDVPWSIDVIQAAGAATSWIGQGRKALLLRADEAGNGLPGSGGGARVVRRGALLIRSACLVFLASVLMLIGVMSHIEARMVDGLQQSSGNAADRAARTAAGLPGITVLPSRADGFRNHRHLARIAEAAVRTSVTIDDVRVGVNRLEIQGFAADMAAIDAFSRESAEYFRTFGASVQPPVSSRDTTNRLRFRTEILWGADR